MHLMVFNVAAIDTLFLCICTEAFFTYVFTILIQQDSMEKTNYSTLYTRQDIYNTPFKERK